MSKRGAAGVVSLRVCRRIAGGGGACCDGIAEGVLFAMIARRTGTGPVSVLRATVAPAQSPGLEAFSAALGMLGRSYLATDWYGRGLISVRRRRAASLGCFRVSWKAHFQRAQRVGRRRAPGLVLRDLCWHVPVLQSASSSCLLHGVCVDDASDHLENTGCKPRANLLPFTLDTRMFVHTSTAVETVLESTQLP